MNQTIQTTNNEHINNDINNDINQEIKYIEPFEDNYEDLYDFNLTNFKSKSGSTHRDNKQNSKKKNKNMNIYSSKHVRLQQSKQTIFMKSMNK